MRSRLAFGLTLAVLGVALLVVLYFLGIESRILPGGDRAQLGRLADVQGRVEVGRVREVKGGAYRKESRDIEWSPARKDMLLYQDDRLRTSSGALSVARLRERDTLRLAENSLIVLDLKNDGKRVGVTLSEGSTDLEGSLDELVVHTGSTQIAGSARELRFEAPSGTGSTLGAQQAHVARFLDLVKEMGAPEKDWSPVRDALARAASASERGDHKTGEAILSEAWETLTGIYARARRASRSRIAVTRSSSGDRIQVLEGEAVVLAASRTLRLEAGTGALVGENRAPEIRTLLPSPLPQGPAEGQRIFNAPLVMLSWKPVEGARAYRLEIARDKSFQDLLEVTQAPGEESKVSRELADGTYFWRVSAVDSHDFLGRASPVGGFTTLTDHERPPLTLKKRSPWQR